MKTILGKTIYAFRAVRYAKAPVGQLRFKNAVPIESWNDIYDATQEGPACPTPTVKGEISEDCLRLNVYSNELPTATKKVKKPVIVFIHPGAFYGYSGQSSSFGPHYYLDQDIVLVTINYRLGVLGFMSTGDARAPGNLGLKDQVVALRWIQNHITKFGGDPNSVTVTGCSAGSWSTLFHLLSPVSKGLFHRAIAISGAPTVPEQLPYNQTHLITKQASFVGCPTDNVDKAIECLKTVPYKQLSDSLPRFAEWYGDPILVWSPVVEPKIPGVERFITDQPENLLRKKQFQQIPVIIGVTKDEFSSAPLSALEQAMQGDDSIYRNVTENWYFAAPISFQYERGTERSKRISREIYKFYFNDKPITVENGPNLGLIYADAQIGFLSHRFAQLLAEYSTAPIYEYQFAYQGRFSWAMWKSGPKKGQPYGVVHQDDLIYLFTMPGYGFPAFNSTDPEVKMIKKLTTMYANFAKTDEPIPKNNNLFKGVHWETLDPKKSNYLEINDNFTMKRKMFADRYALWDRLFPLRPLPK
ncbi:esterase E4-like [Phymastichus coffea]|uniref:esterase E4-like n=1 Tax=Phymastichus coffea TaxID=108790 RepID=UPI00273C91EA|nr:esterase E4-like [Phymastichus coffea]